MSKLNMEASELPYEKCLKYGPSALSDAELIAVILRTGTARYNCIEVAHNILELSHGMGLLTLKHLSLKELQEIEGIGKVKAVMLTCVGELSSRISRATLPDRQQFVTAAAVADYYMEELRHQEREQFYLMQLNNKCRLIHESLLSIGTVSQTCVSVRDIFIEALRNKAVYIIMVHNHPSGDPTPSRDDLQCTEIIQNAGQLLGIPLIDHIIIGDNQYFSFKEQALLGKE